MNDSIDKGIAFIVPVYNVENYLKCCVDSILCQVRENDEIILKGKSVFCGYLNNIKGGYYKEDNVLRNSIYYY